MKNRTGQDASWKPLLTTLHFALRNGKTLKKRSQRLEQYIPLKRLTGAYFKGLIDHNYKGGEAKTNESLKVESSNWGEGALRL
jgi:hypothetical protein